MHRRDLISDSYLGKLRHCYTLFARGRGRRALHSVEDLGANRAVVEGLALGSLIAWYRQSGSRLAGRVF